MNSRTVFLFSEFLRLFHSRPVTLAHSANSLALARENSSLSVSVLLKHDFTRAFFQLYNYITVGSVLPRVLLVFGVREYAWTRISRFARMVNFRKQKLPFYWVSSSVPLPRRPLGCPLPPTSPFPPPNPPFLSFYPRTSRRPLT